MENRTETVRKNIMRRVYYAYAVRLATHRYTLHGAVALVAAVLFVQFVSISAVVRNILALEMSKWGSYAVNALQSTEIWTILTLLVFTAVICSLVFSGDRQHQRPVQFV